MKNKKYRLLKIISIIIFVLSIIILSGSCDEEKYKPLSVEMEPDINAMVNFTISNNGSDDLLFFDLDTPINGHFRQYFKITNENGEEIPYVGKVAAVNLNSSYWTTLKSGEKIKFSVDLTQEYDFPPDIGTYTVSYIFPINIKKGNLSTKRSAFTEKDFSSTLDYEPVKLVSNEVQVEVDNTYDENFRRMEAVRGCSGTQLTEVDQRSILATEMAQKSIYYMQAKGMDNLWNTWWGVDDQGRYDFILNGFNMILDSFSVSWNYNCPTSTDCDGVIAWVYKSNPYNVWLCPGWFSYGTPAYQGSVLIHEASHWYVTIGTDDFGYGESFCKNLAITAPDNAKRNADNYDYFTYYTYLEPGISGPNGTGFSGSKSSDDGCGTLAPDL